MDDSHAHAAQKKKDRPALPCLQPRASDRRGPQPPHVHADDMKKKNEAAKSEREER